MLIEFMKTISIKSVLRSWFLFYMVFLCITSCSIDGDENKDLADGSLVPVYIDLAGISWKGEQDSKKDIDLTDSRVILKGNKDPMVIDNQPRILAMGDNNSIIAYVYLKYDDDNQIEKLKKGDKFRVIAYKKVDGTYCSHKDYVMGQPYEKMELNSGVEYEIVSYTFGSEILPEISDLEKSNVNSASTQFSRDSSSLVAYQKQSFVPVSDNPNKNILSIDLFDQSSSINVIFRSLGSDIPVDNAGFTMHYNTSFSTAKMNLSTGKLSCLSECNREDKFSSNLGGGLNVSYDRKFFTPSDKKGISIDAKVKIFGSEEYLDNIYFYMYQGKKATVYIDLRVCGAYMGTGKTKFKRFMCNDLGGEVINPNQNVMRKEQHGDFYIWSMKSVAVSRKLFQEKPQKMSIWDFDWSEPAKKKAWYIESPHRGFEGVCPEGWRIPDKKEWESVARNNISKDLENDELFTAGVRVGENMLFPVSGFVDYDGKSFLPKKGEGVFRWTYDENLTDPSHMVKNAWMSSLYEKHKNTGVIIAPKFTGVSLRCIKKSN